MNQSNKDANRLAVFIAVVVVLALLGGLWKLVELVGGAL